MERLSFKFLLFSIFAFVASASAQCPQFDKKTVKKQDQISNESKQDQIKFWDNVIKQYPDCYLGYYKRGTIFAGLSDLKAAITDFNKVRDLEWKEPRYEITPIEANLKNTLLSIGENAYKTNDYESCIGAYEIYFRIFPRDYMRDEPGPYIKSGDSYYNLGQLKPAADNYLLASEKFSYNKYLQKEQKDFLTKVISLKDIPNKDLFHMERCDLEILQNTTAEAIADCKAAIAINPNQARAKKILKQLGFEKDDTDEKNKDPRAYVKKHNPKRYELLRRAIEDNDAKALEDIVARVSEFRLENAPKLNSSEKLGRDIDLSVYSPRIKIGMHDKKLKLDITRSYIFSFPPIGDKDDDDYDDGMFNLDYNARYLIGFTGRKIYFILSNKETFNSTWNSLGKRVNEVCRCNSQPNNFPYAYAHSEEMTELASIAVSKIDWLGNISVRIVSKMGGDWTFTGLTFAYDDSLSKEAYDNSFKISKVETGNFGRAKIIKAGAVYENLNDRECIDWSWATPEQKKSAGKSGWGTFIPEEGMEGEIIAKTVDCNYSFIKLAILKVRGYYVPITEDGIKKITVTQSTPSQPCPVPQFGHFGQAKITNNQQVAFHCIKDKCYDMSHFPPEILARMELKDWKGYWPKVGDKGEIVVEVVSCNGFKHVILKIGDNYVPVSETGIKRL